MLSFRTATPQDASALSALVNSAYRGESSTQGWTTEAHLLGGQRTDPDKIQEMIHSEGSQIEVGYETGRPEVLLACVYLKVESDRALYFGMLTVSPVLQGKGMGKLMMNRIEAVARQKQCTRVRMTVISVRAELIAFYERRGYRPTGKTEPFPLEDPRFGIPKVEHLEFLEFSKELKNGAE
jgi:predicted N-acetyltransferase YhbS